VGRRRRGVDRRDPLRVIRRLLGAVSREAGALPVPTQRRCQPRTVKRCGCACAAGRWALLQTGSSSRSALGPSAASFSDLTRRSPSPTSWRLGEGLQTQHLFVEDGARHARHHSIFREVNEEGRPAAATLRMLRTLQHHDTIG